MVHVRVEREGSYRAYTSVPGGAWALPLRVPQEVWFGVVRELGFLRAEKGDRTFIVDGLGPGATLRPGTEEYLHLHHRKPRLCATPPIFQGRSQPAAVAVHRYARFVCSADPYAVSDRLYEGRSLC